MNRLAPFALALGALLAGAAHALPASEVYSLIEPSVWRVQTTDEDGLPIAIGSAVVVGPETLATNCHVLARAQRVQLKHDKQVVAAKLAMWDPARDVCRLRAVGLTAPAVALAPTDSLRVGQTVFTLGTPAGLDLTISEGLLSSIRRNDRQQIVLLQTSAPFSLGSSGGGLFDDQGRLIGLTTLVRSAPLPNQVQSLNFAIPAEWITQLPERFARLKAPATSASSAAPGGEAAEPGTPAFTPPAAGAMVDAAAAPARPAAASLADDSRLPWSTDKMREAYRRFLERDRPRAFAVGENGSWYATWTEPTSARTGIVDPAQRAMLNCQRRAMTRCHLYAVDDRVVYEAPPR